MTARLANESSSIERIDAWLLANRPDYYARLRPGAQNCTLDAIEATLKARLPAAYRLLYCWRDGQESTCSESLQGNRMFLAIDDAIAAKDMLDGMIGTDFEDPRWWRKGWIPFLSNGGGDYLCLDMSSQNGEPGQIVAFWHDHERRPIEYPNFASWLDRLADQMESGELRVV